MEAEIPIPSESDEELSRRGGKRTDRESVESPPKTRRAEAALSEDVLRQLLAETQRAILNAQNDMLTNAIAQLEDRQNRRIQQVEQKMDDGARRHDQVESALREIHGRLQKLEDTSTTAPSESGTLDTTRRKLTLVVGGWPRDSRRAVILAKISEMLKELKVEDLCDENAFCTGPRRTCALLPFRVRTGETAGDARQRMHSVLGAIVKSRTPIEGATKPVWAGVSKTREERLRSAHYGFIRQIAREVDADAVEGLEHDYNAGTTWIGDDKVACMTSTAPTIDSYKLLTMPKERGAGWVNLSALARGLRTTFPKVEAIAKAIN